MPANGNGRSPRITSAPGSSETCTRSDAGHRRDDDDLALVLEQVDRRLPRGLRALRRIQAKELPVQPLGLLDQVAGLRPHPITGIGSAHASKSIA